MKDRILAMLSVALGICLLFPFSAGSQSGADESIPATGNIMALGKAVMCEDIQGNTPLNPTTVFSVERRKAVCFTSFDPVSQIADIYHQWFHSDKPSARVKLTLKPPRWSAYSSIQLRAEDIGPWRVEITDSQGNSFHVLRFSITE